MTSRLHELTIAYSALLLLSACTPIASVNRDEEPGANQARDGVAAAGADGASSTPKNSSQSTGGAPAIGVATVQVASPCSEPGKRACATRDERTPLLCKDSSWQPQSACSDAERCETKAGPQLGTCVAIATDCLSHPPGEDFCDGEFLQSCENLVLTGARSCPDRRRCKEVDNKARCVCAERWVETASGDCQVPTTCAVNNGGCDMSTSCDASSGQRVCGDCKPGFEGTGETGCHAQLAMLRVEGATLVPEFSPSVHSYRVTLPLLRQSIRVTAQAASAVALDFDSVAQESGSVWQSPPLTLGEHKIEINLRTESDLKSKYELVVTRTGVQEAYVKAAHPDKQDQFGGGLAVWGDTLVVGVPDEDSASVDNPGDNSVQDSGAVYVFVRKDDKWVQQDYLKASQPRANDYFGGTIALWGDTLFVGATGANTIGSVVGHGGNVHVFKRQGEKWSYTTSLAPSGVAAQDLFSMSIVADDKRVIVGAPMDQDGQRFSGAFYAYTRNGDSFSEPVRVKANKPVPSGLFAFSLGLDGDTVVVGAPQFNNVLGTNDTGSGTAYVFSASGNQWTQLQELMPDASLEVGATMGWTVAIAGNTVAVGAPRARGANEGQSPGTAYIYERASGGGWGLKQPLQATVPRVSDWFAWQLQLTASALVIGAPGDNSGSTGLMADPKNEAAKESGALYMYARDKDQWVATTFIKVSNPGFQDDFGALIAVYGDTLASAATGESSDASGIDGNQTSDALSRAGAAYVFR